MRVSEIRVKRIRVNQGLGVLSNLEISLQITATRENHNNNQVSSRSDQYDSICLYIRDTN